MEDPRFRRPAPGCVKIATITSRHNPLLQEVRRAVAAGRLTTEGYVVAEGPHLLEEAARGVWTVALVLATPTARKRWASVIAGLGAEVVEVSEAALASAAGTEQTQGVLTLLRPHASEWETLLSGTSPSLLVLDGLQDPGNAGTLVRSAEAFGATGVVFLPSSVRVSNAKFLRATAGSIFRLPYLEGVDAEELLSQLERRSVTLWALAAQGSSVIWQADLRQGWALAVGGEGDGVSTALLRRARMLRIPAPGVESLNAAVAGSIALFEASRQRAL